MSISYINADLRRLVVARANGLCEYCLIAQEDMFFGGEVDHIISEKHGGLTVAENLAHACVFCNQAKGSDVGSIYWETGEFVRFFNPRSDRWAAHFALSGVKLDPLTPIGAVTARMLGFNRIDRFLERQALQMINRYPTEEAVRRMSL